MNLNIATKDGAIHAGDDMGCEKLGIAFANVHLLSVDVEVPP